MTQQRSILQSLLGAVACVAALSAAAPVSAQTSDPKFAADLATGPAAEDTTTGVGSAMFFPFAGVSAVPAHPQPVAERDEALEGPDVTLWAVAGLTGIAALGFVRRRARDGSAQVAW